MKFRQSKDVLSPTIISTNFITGTGFIKCMPITLSLLFVAFFDNLFIEIDDVLDASIVEFYKAYQAV